MQGSPSDSEGLEEILQSTSLSGRHGSTPDCPNDHDQMSGLARDHGNDDFSDDRRLPFGGFDSFINPMTGRPTTSSDGAGVGHARMRMVLVVSPMGPNENQHRPMQGIDSYQRSSPRPSDEYEASRRLPVSSLLRGGPGFGELGLAFPFSRGGQQAMFPVSPDDAFAGSSHGNLHTTGGPTITEIDDGVHDHNWQYPDRALSTGPKITELLDNDCGRASNSKHGQPKVTAHAPTKRRNKNATVIRNFPVHPEITSASNSTSVSSLDSFTSSTEHSSLNDNGTARRKHVSREKDTVDHKLPNYQDKNPGLTDLNGKSDANMLPSSQGDIHRPTVHYHVNIDDIPTDSDSETGVSDSGDDYSVDDNYDLNSLFDMELASIGNPDNEIEALNAEMKSDESNNLKHNEEHTQGMESSVKRADKYPKTTEGAEFIKPTNDNNNLDKVPTTQDSIREDHVATLHTESSSRESTETTRIANAATTECSTEIGKVTNTPSDDDVKQPQPRQDVHRSHRPHRKSTSSCQHHHTHTIHHCQNGILVHCVGCWLQWHTVCTCASPKGKRCKDKNKNMGRSQTDDSIREFTSPGASRSPHNANVGVTFDDLLHTVGLSVKEVHPDGNCLFSAVVDQLRVIGQFRHTARSLRTATVDYLERNPYQEDGTHLSAFIDHHSGDTWQQYLTNLRNEGHWGDQITVCALANVLRRRIVIYKHLGTHLDSTVVSPMAANASALDTEGRSDKSPTADTTIGLQGGLVDDDIELCLGHVDDAHYVSLRKLDWKESLNQDSNEGVTIVKDRPINVDVWYSEIEVDFVFNFVRRQRFLCHCPYKDTGCTAYQSPTVQELVCNFNSSLEFSWDIGYSRKHVTPESERHVQLTFPIDSRARLPKEDSISKDVVVNTEGCPMGHLCLEPVMPSLWQYACMTMNGKSHLKHSHFNIDVGSEESRPPAPLTGFLCTWPVEACEWIARTRPSGWPSVTDIEHVVANGCHVQPALGYAVNLWEFSFLRSDHMLYTRCMTLAMKSYFFIVVALLESTFQEGVLLGNAHWRTLFFYMLEVTTNSQIKTRPYKCLLIMLDRLEWCLKTNMFPDYYIQSKNMFGSFDIDNGTLCWYLQRLTYLREAPVQTLLCVIDDGECAEEHTFLKVLDDITELNTASQEGMSDSEYARSLMAICTHGIKRWIDYKQFSRALQMIRTLLVQWTTRFDMLDVNGDDLIEQTMYRLTLEQQCVFAFLIDTTDGTNWMERFRSRCACVPLLNILGSDAPSLPEVPNITWSDIWIPEHVLYGNLAAFMKEFTLVLYRDLDRAAASILILHKFLKCNTHDIILGVTTETESAIPAKSMHLSSLYHLYVFMYHLLYERSDIDTFSELMGLFDETCNCLGFPYNLRFIAKLWSHFGHQDRAEDAIMKADVIENDLKMRESRL